MKSPYDMFKADSKMETEGVILDYGSFNIKIARAGGANTAFAKTMERLMKPYRTAIRNEVLDSDLAQKILIEAYADAVVLDWQGVTDASGKKLDYSKNNVVKVLTDLPDLFRDIQEQANKLVLFRKETLEAAAKNS
jgi:hypothetical protein